MNELTLSPLYRLTRRPSCDNVTFAVAQRIYSFHSIVHYTTLHTQLHAMIHCNGMSDPFSNQNSKILSNSLDNALLVSYLPLLLLLSSSSFD